MISINHCPQIKLIYTDSPAGLRCRHPHQLIHCPQIKQIFTDSPAGLIFTDPPASVTAVTRWADKYEFVLLCDEDKFKVYTPVWRNCAAVHSNHLRQSALIVHLCESAFICGQKDGTSVTISIKLCPQIKLIITDSPAGLISADTN